MSKLYDTYLSLKRNQEDRANTLYLFKSGIFFIFLDSDAKLASTLLNLKLSNFTNNVVKCGFPVASLYKYLSIFNTLEYNFKIVDQNISYSVEDFYIDTNIKDFLNKISNIDTDSLSIRDAYSFIDEIKNTAISLLGGAK